MARNSIFSTARYLADLERTNGVGCGCGIVTTGSWSGSGVAVGATVGASATTAEPVVAVAAVVEVGSGTLEGATACGACCVRAPDVADWVPGVGTAADGVAVASCWAIKPTPPMVAVIEAAAISSRMSVLFAFLFLGRRPPGWLVVSIFVFLVPFVVFALPGVA
jgi:hypothetical protein